MNMRDPMSQMAAAQKLSISQLQQALRNGTIDPQVGQIVLASKIKQDKDAKMAMAAQAPKQPPVAAQNMAYGAGVDALPSNLPAQGMAGGGIIAFEEGGEVVRANEGLYVPTNFSAPGLSQADVDYSNAMQESFLYNPTFQQTAGTILSPGISSFNYLADKIGGTAWVRDPKTGKLIRKSDLPKPTAADKQAERLREQQAGLAEREAYNKKQQQARILANPAQLNGPYAPDMNPEAMAAKQAQLLQSRVAGVESPAGDKPVSSIEDLLGGAGNRAGSRTDSKGIADGYTIKPYADARTSLEAQLKAEMNPATGKEYTYEEKAAERKARQAAAGVDFDLYGKQKEELEGKKTLSDTRSRLNEAMPFFALAERLGQAPKPGETTVTALSSALAGAGRTKAEIDDKEEARQERIGDKLNALAVAQNQFNAAQFSGNDAAEKEAKAAIRAARSNLTNLGIKDVDQQNEMSKTLFELQSRERIADKQVAASYYSADKAQNTVMNIARALQGDNPGMTNSEAIKKAYEISNPGFAAIGQRDVDSQRDALNAQLKLISPFDKSPEAVAKRKRISDALNALTIAGSSGAPSANTVSFSQLNPG